MVNRKELNPDSSPQAAFGARLRRLREERGWIQDHLASLVGCTGRHISAIETGRKPPTLPFARKADTALGLVASSDSFEREWREMKHGSLLEGFPEYVGYEGRAVEIRLFEIGLIPGLMQTPQYARTLADGDVQRGSITPEQAEERVSFLMERQAALVRPRPPMVLVVMDESCLHQAVGGPKVMDAQLQRLEEVASLPNWIIHVAPFAIGTRRAFNLPVNLLTLADRSVVAYAESQAQGHVERESSLVVSMLTAYHQLQGEALSQAASVAKISQLRKGTP
ncbi:MULTISPECIES: helix-turn-helix transcriptional regulator [unclassified Streptomyces]|uniref:helix-turn-helix domain-containing protein n=1 Tax=unclassified Streptomyces TaxID=2593676 RepID=UPI0001C19012|nr:MULTISPECIES: helix-turn-helix transcriptional regulator [unclassified Streptomyces]AEN10489.1 transcriptional regulator, XRE family [Streptomyces sp. SirexAA-E]MYR70441.1 helix-turn-helix domain-containing protein [Streptomyces sp. SID4939]MYS00174.1 helix-turn-helix domain-containing protein [Streptomyces sp. SID4940]MYT62321.1 helix-turn-helix domain-containing protein [Streptomyces sp. SID8357]MYT83883.1 helix-turn-helix domain-containing protein [Streptomyces sp. SID8360]